MLFFGFLNNHPIRLIKNIISIVNKRKYLKKAGENIVLCNEKYHIKSFIGCSIGFLVPVIYCIVRRPVYFLSIILLLMYLSVIIEFVSNKLYEKINGIYENGIILNECITWNEIHSYKWINEETISLLKNDGMRIDFDKIINNDKMMETIIANKINENNN